DRGGGEGARGSAAGGGGEPCGGGVGREGPGGVLRGRGRRNRRRGAEEASEEPVAGVHGAQRVRAAGAAAAHAEREGGPQGAAGGGRAGGPSGRTRAADAAGRDLVWAVRGSAVDVAGGSGRRLLHDGRALADGHEAGEPGAGGAGVGSDGA